MDTSNLSSLKEDESCDEQQPPSQLPPQPQPPSSVSVFSDVPDRPATRSPSQKYSPLDWQGYFDDADDIHIPDTDNVFHIYKAGSEGPVVFCLHGGGYSGLSFALSASKIKEKAQLVAMDLRGHGKSMTDNDLDLAIETLCTDVLAVIKAMYGDSPPAIVLVGHSMGGSVAVHVAAKKTLPSLAGLVVVDVVEGTALASLMHMQKILSGRMQHFPTIEKAVEWSVKGGSFRNIDSARVSIPATLKYDDSKQCYVHRARLEETEQYWRGWYEGLSEKFLSSPVPKLLLLAGTDRLDRKNLLELSPLVKCKASFKWWLSDTQDMPYRRMYLMNFQLLLSISYPEIELVPMALRYLVFVGRHSSLQTIILKQMKLDGDYSLRYNANELRM